MITFVACYKSIKTHLFQLNLVVFNYLLDFILVSSIRLLHVQKQLFTLVVQQLLVINKLDKNSPT